MFRTFRGSGRQMLRTRTIMPVRPLGQNIKKTDLEYRTRRRGDRLAHLLFLSGLIPLRDVY